MKMEFKHAVILGAGIAVGYALATAVMDLARRVLSHA